MKLIVSRRGQVLIVMCDSFRRGLKCVESSIGRKVLIIGEYKIGIDRKSAGDARGLTV